MPREATGPDWETSTLRKLLELEPGPLAEGVLTSQEASFGVSARLLAFTPEYRIVVRDLPEVNRRFLLDTIGVAKSATS